MGETIIRHCDFCMEKAATIACGSLNLHGVELQLGVWRTPVWGDKEFVVQWKGELCPSCMIPLEEAIARTFEKVKGERAPASSTRSVVDETVDQICKSCLQNRAWHKKHRPRHRFAATKQGKRA